MSEHQVPNKAKTPEDVLRIVHDEKILFVNLWFTDLTGIVKNITIPVTHLEEALSHGVWFDGSSIQGFARIAESDMYLRPDIKTFAIIPWEPDEPKTARLICDVYTPQDEPFIGDPRNALKRVLAEAREMGFNYFTGPELEFFLFKPNADGSFDPLIPHDIAGYFDMSTDLALSVRRQMVIALNAIDIDVEALHHEVATGQHEIDFRYADALKSADSAVTYRVALKAVAQRVGLHCTFMPKPVAFINGSGMHVHQSFAYTDTGKNAFADMDDEYGLSDTAKHFIAGQLKHARGLAAVIAPLVNSYKRLVPGYEAPVYVSWARVNRSALIRVPRIVGGREEESTRLELRCPDPSCNPYLAFAAMLKAGLDGIKNKLPWPDPVEENLYHLRNSHERLETLPGSLGEALDELEKNTVIQEALGPHIYARYLEAKRQEYDEYRLHVTSWELDRYLVRY